MPVKDHYHRIHHTIEYLYDHAKQQPSLHELAQHAHLSPEHFQKVFTQYTGLSPKQMLSYLNIETAKSHLLAHKNLMQTALATGLSGTGRLHDLFIKIEGMTPFEYQQGGAHLTIYYAFHDTPQGITLHLKGTPFQLKVWQALLTIPRGHLSTYSQIAEQVANPNAQRAVGSAIAKNPIAVLIPCHRVIRETGIIGQYRWGHARKMVLLAQEQASQQ